VVIFDAPQDVKVACPKSDIIIQIQLRFWIANTSGRETVT
jgi:hypothetical protein